MKRQVQITAATAVVMALAGAAGAQDGCNIKANVSTKGERIYHVPGNLTQSGAVYCIGYRPDFSDDTDMRCPSFKFTQLIGCSCSD